MNKRSKGSKKRKKTIGKGLLQGMKEALAHAQSVEASSESQTLQEENLQAVNAAIEAEEYEKELKKFLIPILRRASYRWKYRSEAIKKARVARGLYRCAMCEREDVKNKEFAVDHIDPIVPLEGWNGQDWIAPYIRRMLVKTKGWQVLCNSCHDLKTQTEVQIRKLNRNATKG